MIGYNLIETPNLEMSKLQLAPGFNLIEAQTLVICKLWFVLSSNLIKAPTSFFNSMWTIFQNLSDWILLLFNQYISSTYTNY